MPMVARGRCSILVVLIGVALVASAVDTNPSANSAIIVDEIKSARNGGGNLKSSANEIIDRHLRHHLQEIGTQLHAEQVSMAKSPQQGQDASVVDNSSQEVRLDARKQRFLRKTGVAKRINDLQARSNITAQNLGALEVRVDAMEKSINNLIGSIHSRLAAMERELENVTSVVDLNTVGTPAHCGCYSCSDSLWNTQAPAGAGDQFTCGSRIKYLEGQGMSHLDACRTIAVAQLPTECSGCNPDACDIVGAAGNSASIPHTPAPTLAPNHLPLSPSTSLYCYPPFESRQRWTNVWSQYKVEVKEDLAGGLCGPGNNKFTTNTVSVAGNELTLQYKMVNGGWEASEVRVVLPDKYTYGTYKFSVKSVATIDSATGSVASPNLSEDLVLGMFTWDDTEDYASHENYNHEVDVEISRWGDKANADAQYVVQPPENPHYFRFFTGAGNTYSPGGQTYEFTWNPTSISWKSSGGTSYSYTTKMALDSNLPDYIQCLPANVEVRLNIWNKNGNVAPAGMSDTQVAQVVIDNFTFTPSYADSVANGETCSKDCQCLAESRCIGNVCAPK